MVIIFFLKNTTIYNIIILCCILLYLYSYHEITIFQCIKFFLNLLTTTFQCSLSFFKYDTVLITFSFAQIERSNFNLLQFYWLLNSIEFTSTNYSPAPILAYFHNHTFLFPPPNIFLQNSIVKRSKRVYSEKTIRYDIYDIKWLLLRTVTK